MKKRIIYSDFTLNCPCMLFNPFLTLFLLATYPFVLFLLFAHRMQTRSINQIKSLSTLILSPPIFSAYKCPLYLCFLGTLDNSVYLYCFRTRSLAVAPQSDREGIAEEGLLGGIQITISERNSWNLELKACRISIRLIALPYYFE